MLSPTAGQTEAAGHLQLAQQDRQKLLVADLHPPLHRPKPLAIDLPSPLDPARQQDFRPSPPTVTQSYLEGKRRQHGGVITKDLYLGINGEP